MPDTAMAGLQSRSSFGIGVSCRIARYAAGEAGLERLRPLEERAELCGARRVAGGNHGDIILAQDRHAPRALAVKVVSLDRCFRSGNDEASLRKEVRALQELRGHPNLVQLVDVLSRSTQLPGAQGAPPYLCIAMEYVPDSEPLAGQIKRGGAQPQLSQLVLPQLASALEFMHDRGFVHRDVWSENVLIGRGCHAVLVDLGSAERCAPGCRLKVPPKVNLSYASPEATESWGPQPGDDAWSLGLLSAEMVTGRFIGDILGRTDIPIHLVPAALKALLTEAASLASPGLGQVTRGLLARLKDRLLMKDVAATLRSEVKGSVKMDWSPPPLAESSPAPATPKVQPSQFRASTSFAASPSFAEMNRAISPNRQLDMRCQSTSPNRNRAPPPRVESTTRRSKSLVPSSSFNAAAVTPGSPFTLGAARSLTFGVADLKSTLTGLLRPSALSFGISGFEALTGSVAMPAGVGRRAQSPALMDTGESPQSQPMLPPPPMRSPAVGSRSRAPEAIQQAPRGVQPPPPLQTRSRGTNAQASGIEAIGTPSRHQAPPDQHAWEDGQPAVQSFGWSPSGLASARGRQPGAPHATSPQHTAHGGRAGEMVATAPAHSPAKVAQGPMALPPQAVAVQPMQLMAHLLPPGATGSIAVPTGRAAAPPGSAAVPPAAAAPVQPLLMMCQSFFGGGGVKQVVQAGLLSPTPVRCVR